jgi:hypothetical protein
LRGSFYLSIS